MSWIGKLFGGERVPREGDVLPVGRATTPEPDAIELARRAAIAAGRPWLTPVRAELIWHGGRACWFVSTNAQARGHSVTVAVDDVSQEIVRIAERPR